MEYKEIVQYCQNIIVISECMKDYKVFRQHFDDDEIDCIYTRDDENCIDYNFICKKTSHVLFAKFDNSNHGPSIAQVNSLKELYSFHVKFSNTVNIRDHNFTVSNVLVLENEIDSEESWFQESLVLSDLELQIRTMCSFLHKNMDCEECYFHCEDMANFMDKHKYALYALRDNHDWN